MKSLRSPLGRVGGLGSAKSGAHHWWLQRLTSIALVPLTIWFAVSLLALPSLDHVTVISWIAQSWNALLLILLVLVGAYHSQLGVQVVVEDYVKELKTVTMVVVTFAHVLLAAAGVFAILRVAFGVAA
jgi:succinate dehydrogenase membrane anchor subunit